MKYLCFSLSLIFCSCLFATDKIPGAEFAIAIESGDLDAIKSLIASGAKADTIIDYGEHKITPLMKAAWDGELEIAEFLLESGANVQATDESGETPLYSAIKRGRVEIAQILIDRGAKVNIKDVRQFTPLTTAAAAGEL